MNAPAHRELHLGYMYWLNGTHWGGWRQPDAPTADAFSLEYPTRAIKLAEAAKFDFFFLGDTLPGDVYQEHWNTTHNGGRLEPFTLGSQLALQTSKIGIAVTAHPTYYEPYILARLTASLDHLSHGRLAWNVVLGASDLAARNFSLPDLGGERRYARADEHIRVVRKLWDSIEDGAYLQDKDSGHYLDPSKIHRLEHKGEFFEVAGTLPMARPPQGQIPLLYAGASELSRELTARHCEINFTGPADIPASAAFNADVRERAARIHGKQTPIFFLPGISPVIGDTHEDAQATYARLNAAIPIDEDPIDGAQDDSFWSSPDWLGLVNAGQPLPVGLRSLRALSELVGVDLRGDGLDGAISAEHAERFNERGRKTLTSLAARTGRSVEKGAVTAVDLLQQASVGGFPPVIGTPEEVADHLIDWFTSGAADGFNINSPYMWNQFERFTTQVVPILQDKGLFRREYTTDTFRGHFGLPIPANQFSTDTARGGVSGE
ncbi:NtaA/DmoA family FMN-dependent monooxygenase [Gordonia sp. DT219]|uniref:NtaA/DmoA family FMN-dependent monooxygenase n=1 Tax=Gordonia sp. DT219 TaxID=3416658 RepID=UPI003CF1AB51